MKDQDHIKYNAALESGHYRTIFIKRQGSECFLVIDVDGTPHVYVKQDGKAKVYRHIWQLKEWLKSQFKIEIDDNKIETIK